MAVITATAAKIRPLEGAVIRQKVASAAFDVGDSVTLLMDGTVIECADSTSKFYGIAVATSGKDTPIAIGEDVAICIFGPVTGFAGMQPGTLAYLSGTAGKLDTAGTVAVAFAETATEVFIMPGVSSVGS